MPSTPPQSPPQPLNLLRPPNSLPPSLLERYFAQHEFSTPLLACCSDVEPLTVRELLEISGKEETTGEETIFEGGRLSLGYLDPRGSLRLREAVAREHGGGDGGDGSEGRVTADDVLVAAPQELAYLLQRVLLQEGDTVVAQWPGYPGLTAVAEAVGATVVPWLPRWEEEDDEEEGEEEKPCGGGAPAAATAAAASAAHAAAAAAAPSPPRPGPRPRALRPRFDVEEDLRAALEKAASLVRSPPPGDGGGNGGGGGKGGGKGGRRPPALRLAVLNFPHNPTGCSLPSAAALERALSLCLDHGALHVLSDEMYRGLHLSKATAAAEALPTAAGLAAASPALSGRRRRSERVASLGGLSKWGGAPGLRIGWLVCKDRTLLENISALRDHTTICNSAPSEALALAALGESPAAAERLRARARAIVERNVAAAARAFSAAAAASSDFFDFYAPEASTTCLPRLRTEIVGISVDEFARRAREEAGVLLLPASAFGGGGGAVVAVADGGGGGGGGAGASSSSSSSSLPAPPVPDWMEGRFRLGLGRRNLPAALEALERLVEKMRGEELGGGAGL